MGRSAPSRLEWIDLVDYLGVSGYIGTEGLALKSASGWFFGGNANDDYGFAALH